MKVDNNINQSLNQVLKESDSMIKRILFLEGLPNLQDLGKLNIDEDVPEVLTANLNMELSFRAILQVAIAKAEKERDYVTRDCLKECLEACEDKLDYFETQISLLSKVGTDNYHQSIM
ncbi:bacterioferritin [Isorropodon fossajaponicum endosymbiont JTNG4]|uniref:ferritin-like domain-containing protein n=1 Tax=Isorropodon fossajaponicum symbiont TaxID=883811 RepID=UPI00191541CF|nr:ferritin-like domain-containing protein [Isorropodon fossajaponicum symbiont]BBB23995.1 bacterioferritin [Isorropodon fossajaponicum endosymbiont JTNG4]